MSTAPLPPHPESSTPAAAGGFGRLARRIFGWTANLLATAIVLVAGLALGRQVLVWWNEVSPAPAAQIDVARQWQLPSELPAELRLWTSGGPVELAQVHGDRAVVLAAMRRSCQGPGSGPTNLAQAGPGELRYLARLAKLAPVEQTNDLDLYAPDESVTMVVAVSRKDRRIAAWSFALPVNEATWSCYTFFPAAGSMPNEPGVDAGVNRRVRAATDRASLPEELTEPSR